MSNSGSFLFIFQQTLADHTFIAVVIAAAGFTSVQQTSHQFFFTYFQRQHQGYFAAFACQQNIQRFGLGCCSGEPIKQKAFGVRVGIQGRTDHANNHFIRHQLAFVHECLRFQAQLGSIINFFTQQNAR